MMNGNIFRGLIFSVLFHWMGIGLFLVRFSNPPPPTSFPVEIYSKRGTPFRQRPQEAKKVKSALARHSTPSGPASAPEIQPHSAPTSVHFGSRADLGGDPRVSSNPNSDPFLNQVRQRIQESLDYPLALRRRRIHGQVIIRMTLGTEGNLQSSEIARSSGYPELDEIALQAVADASPFPMEEERQKKMGKLSLSLPILFELNN